MPSTLKNAPANLDALERQIRLLLAENRAPEAYGLLQASRHLDQSPRFKLLECVTLWRVGRFELCRKLAEEILASDPRQPEARELLDHVRPVTEAPWREARSGAGQIRSYSSEIPKAFLDRLQASVHHYTYKGVQLVKSPFELALYPLLLWNLKPRTILEIGSKEGGSALWFADQAGMLGIDTDVVSIDLLPVDGIRHDRVTFLGGDGRNLGATLSDAFLARLPHPWLVVEDADHLEATSTAVLDFFDPWLQVGDYIVVEDGILSNLFPETYPGCSSGPHQAVKRFLSTNGSRYRIDPTYCDFYGHNVTWASNGFLRKTA
jgi:cephalosporin hydroxylase